MCFAGIFLCFLCCFFYFGQCSLSIFYYYNFSPPDTTRPCCLIYIKKRKYGVYDIETASNENNLRHQRSNTRGVFTNSRIYTLRLFKTKKKYIVRSAIINKNTYFKIWHSTTTDRVQTICIYVSMTILFKWYICDVSTFWSWQCVFASAYVLWWLLKSLHMIFYSVRLC